MIVELLVVPDCPHEQRARRAVAEAAARAGIHDYVVTLTVVDSEEDAERRRFAGSPTVLIDGVDPFASQCGSAGLGRVGKSSHRVQMRAAARVSPAR